MSDELNISGNRIPFYMIALTIFFRGSIFIILNAPILYQYFKGSHYSSFSELIDKGILITWKSVLNTNTSLSAVSIFILISLILGMALNPLQLIISSFFAFILEIPKFLKHKRDELKLFSPFLYANEDYINVMEWLSNNRTADVQWEWQQFHYHIWWTFTTNILIFIIITLSLLPQEQIFKIILWLSLVIIIFIGGSLYHSWHMGNVHAALIKRMNKDENWNKISFKS